MRWLACVVAVGGCNWVFGLQTTQLEQSIEPDADPRIDLDRDGVKDIVDPCIAPASDMLTDVDGDGVANGVDPCPLDKLAGGDVDQDGIPDACDPFPTTGDRLRCFMAFTDPDLDVVMWKQRETPTTWTLYEPRYLRAGDGTIVADWPFEAPVTTTYDVAATVLYPTITGSFDVLARAGADAASESGCELVTSSTVWNLGPSSGPGGTASMPTPAGPTMAVPIRFLVTIESSASGANLRCTVRALGAAMTITASAMLPPGHLGFTSSYPLTRGLQIELNAIAIYERSDAPAL